MSKAFLVALPEELKGVNEIHGHPVMYSGVGKINAAIGTFKLIQQGVTEIINIGSCGSKHHAMGEILKIGKVYQDIDCSPICEYGLTAFESSGPFIDIDPSSTYSCFTTDYFFDHPQSDKYSPYYLNRIQQCSVLDMELYAIAKVCEKFGVHLTAYKWVSDDGDFSKWEENCEIASHKIIDLLASHLS